MYDIKDSYYQYADFKDYSVYFEPGTELTQKKQEDEAYKDNLREKSKNQMGFVAQELKEVFPELVYRIDDTSNYAINYNGLIPVLVEAFKEQQTLLEEQAEKIASLEKLVGADINNKKSATSASSVNESISSTDAVLYQNLPNPFTQNTTIAFYIPDEFSEALIYIFDMNGSQISSIELETNGNSSVLIGGNELEPGMYFYTLIVDNIEIDTKKMILTSN